MIIIPIRCWRLRNRTRRHLIQRTGPGEAEASERARHDRKDRLRDTTRGTRFGYLQPVRVVTRRIAIFVASMAPDVQPHREEGSPAPAKRKRVASATSEAQQLANRPPTKKARLASDLSISAAADGRILDTIDSKYDVHVHPVNSSSKIQKKVTSVLRHLASSAPPAEGASTTKPRICILRAKAADAGKLVSIAEIAKRQMATQEGNNGQAGQCYQYIGLGQEIKETPKDKAVIEETILEEKDHANDGEEDEDDFEYMKTPLERSIEGKPKKQVIAIMSLFLARVSVDELKRRYGEQTTVEIVKAKT